MSKQKMSTTYYNKNGSDFVHNMLITRAIRGGPKRLFFLLCPPLSLAWASSSDSLTRWIVKRQRAKITKPFCMYVIMTDSLSPSLSRTIRTETVVP